MTQTKTSAFGRRTGPIPTPLARPAASPQQRSLVVKPTARTLLKKPLDGGVQPAAASPLAEDGELARTLGAQMRSTTEDPTAFGRKVPWSAIAALIAGVVACLLQSGGLILSTYGSVEVIPGFKVDVGQTSILAPLLISAGLIEGARVAAFSLLLAHAALRLVNVTNIFAYALFGALAGAAQAMAMSVITGVPMKSALAEAVTGLIAGYFYRMFAGVKKG
jgi:hypothetical protein